MRQRRPMAAAAVAGCAACAAGAAAGGAVTPAQMVEQMHVGYNLGATLSAPHEGDWFPPAEEWIFETVRQQGFRHVRLPVRWDNYADAAGNVNAAWMARVAEVVGWVVGRGMVAVLNSHHDDWVCDTAGFSAALPRFTNIWAQVGARFANYSNSELAFEVFNEPNALSISQFNTMNQQVLQTIRKSHATRIVLFMGLNYGNPGWFYDGADGSSGGDMWWPADDQYVMLEFHSYDPYEYAGIGSCTWSPCAGHELPTVLSWGSSGDKATVMSWMDKMQAYASKRGLAVYYGELGVSHNITAAGGRTDWYRYHRDQAVARGFALAPWDGSRYELLGRTTREWDEDVVAALQLAPPPAPTPPAPAPPAPGGCPGGSLSACMTLCPGSPAAAYKACVADCAARC